MRIRMAQVLGMAGLLMMGGMGCRRFSKDTDKVLANVAGEKITAGQFQAAVKIMVQDDKKVEDLVKNEASKDQRNQFLESMALQKAMVRFGRSQGLDKDPKTKLLLEQAQASVYFQVLRERRTTKAEPTDAQLKALYDEAYAQQKAAGREKAMPPYEIVKDRLKGMWKQQEQQKQEQTASEGLLKEMRQKYPVTYADGYKPAVPAGQETK